MHLQSRNQYWSERVTWVVSHKLIYIITTWTKFKKTLYIDLHVLKSTESVNVAVAQHYLKYLNLHSIFNWICCWVTLTVDQKANKCPPNTKQNPQRYTTMEQRCVVTQCQPVIWLHLNHKIDLVGRKLKIHRVIDSVNTLWNITVAAISTQAYNTRRVQLAQSLSPACR